MNRTDRLLAIVLELQGRGHARAMDLAQQLEVSKRTIYRDVLALNEAGVPIISAPGQGYSLMPGYFLPPLRFSVEEAVMLLLGSDVTAQTFDADLSGAARSAARKISAVLDPEMQAELHFLRDNLRLVKRDPGGETTRALLRTLRQAIVERRTVAFAYHKPQVSPQEADTRRVDPHGLFQLNTLWMLSAFDHLRGELRTFRLDRMAGLTVLEQRFERQADFRLARDESREGRELTVQVHFAPEVTRQVSEELSYYVTHTQEHHGGLLVTLRVRAVEDILPWLRSWGSAARVLAPAHLQVRLTEEAQRVVRQYA